jgi:membrane protease YdiL (CAAX protease family)
MRLDIAIAHTWPAIALLLAVAVVYPLLGLRRYRKIEHLPDPLPAGMRTRFYINIIVSQWTLVALVAVVMNAGGRGLWDLGQSLGRNARMTLITAVALVVGFALLSSFTLRQLRRATASELPPHARRAGRILPRTASERMWFVGVALTAGICEEILYRGYLPWMLWSLGLNAWVGCALAVLAFALGHAYQGRSGVVVTGVLGVFLFALLSYTRSLVPGQVLHVLIDLVNGIALGGTMARLEGVAPSETPELGRVDRPNASDAPS